MWSQSINENDLRVVKHTKNHKIKFSIYGNVNKCDKTYSNFQQFSCIYATMHYVL